jgi:hypothetical protein
MIRNLSLVGSGLSRKYPINSSSLQSTFIPLSPEEGADGGWGTARSLFRSRLLKLSLERPTVLN